jgi:hypothetical protein
MENIYSVLITAITVLGGTTAFRFYEKRAMRKERDDEKDEMRNMILDLTKQVAALTVKVEYLTKENEELSKKAKPKKQVLNG